MLGLVDDGYEFPSFRAQPCKYAGERIITARIFCRFKATASPSSLESLTRAIANRSRLIEGARDAWKDMKILPARRRSTLSGHDSGSSERHQDKCKICRFSHRMLL
jgi:hypothetical protein